MKKKEIILNKINDKIIDLIMQNDVDIDVKNCFGKCVDYEVGVGVGLRQALHIVQSIMREYEVRSREIQFIMILNQVHFANTQD